MFLFENIVNIKMKKIYVIMLQKGKLFIQVLENYMQMDTINIVSIFDSLSNLMFISCIEKVLL